MNKKAVANYFLIGFSLFSVFFGAGNLIFPPAIGIQSGSAWGTAVAGISVSAVLLPILAVIAVNNMGRDLEGLSKPVAPWLCPVYILLFAFFIAPLCLSRQGGVAVETGQFGLFPALGGDRTSLFIGLLIYFGLVFLSAMRPSKVVDILGKMFVPFLLGILLLITVTAFARPIGVPGDTGIASPFTDSFLQGYQTGDVIVGLVIASVFISDIRSRGYHERKEVNDITLKSAIVAFAGFFVIYSGLIYLGATGSTIFPADMDQTLLLTSLVNRLTGSSGKVLLCIGVYLACLTSSIGTVASVSGMVVKLTRGKIPYHLMLAFCCVTGITIGSVGVSSIVAFAYPCFILVYPASIVLTLLGVFKNFVPNHGAWKGAVLMAAFIGVFDALSSMRSDGLINIEFGVIEKIYNALPLASVGMAWFAPSLFGAVIGALIIKFTGKEAYPML